MYVQPTLIIPLLVRRYIAWTERGVVQRCVTLDIADLQSWERTVEIPTGVEVLPLASCASDWLIRRLHNEAFADSPGYRPATPLHIIAFRSAPYHDPWSIFVAREGKRYLGFCVGRNRPGGRGLINGLGVIPAGRGRGIARALLRTTLTHLKREGASDAMIRVHPDNAPAIRLYWSEGFIEREQR
jgi:GNAT superfamily N-acetyltransferase